MSQAGGVPETAGAYPKAARTRRKAPWWAKLALLGGTLAFMFLATEAALRLVGAKPKTATVLTTYFRFSPTTGWIGSPNAASRFATTNFDVYIEHDADGWRRCGLESSIATDASQQDEVVWCLGDSGTWGWGVADGKTYVDVLNQMHDGRIYRNLGACGFSSIQQYLMLKELFEQGQRPKQVTVFYCGNDLVENLDGKNQDPPRPYLEVIDGHAELRNYPVASHMGWNLRSWLKRHSLAYNYLHFYLMAAKQGLKNRSTRPIPSSAPPAIQQQTWPELNEAEQQQLVALRESYRLMKELCDQHQVRLAVISEGEGAERFLEPACAGLDIPILDLPQWWRRHWAAPNAQSLAFPTDPHYNETGHRLIAEAIHTELDRLAATRGTNVAAKPDR